jgi:hypothetical protein
LAAAWLALTFLLSVAPGALSRWGGAGLGFEGAPCVPLALIPWIAVAGWPRHERGRLRALSVIGLMLPALALALAADLQAALSPSALAETAAWGAILCAALAWSAERGGELRSAAWFALVPGCALLLLAWAFVGGASARSGVASWLAASPLAWPVLRVQDLRVAQAPSVSVPWGPLAIAAILMALATRSAPREGIRR